MTDANSQNSPFWVDQKDQPEHPGTVDQSHLEVAYEKERCLKYGIFMGQRIKPKDGGSIGTITDYGVAKNLFGAIWGMTIEFTNENGEWNLDEEDFDVYDFLDPNPEKI